MWVLEVGGPEAVPRVSDANRRTRASHRVRRRRVFTRKPVNRPSDSAVGHVSSFHRSVHGARERIGDPPDRGPHHTVDGCQRVADSVLAPAYYYASGEDGNVIVVHIPWPSVSPK